MSKHLPSHKIRALEEKLNKKIKDWKGKPMKMEKEKTKRVPELEVLKKIEDVLNSMKKDVKNIKDSMLSIKTVMSIVSASMASIALGYWLSLLGIL